MPQSVLRSSSGEILYYWFVNDKGIHFQYEFYGKPEDPMPEDLEVQFTMPESEYDKVYEMFGLLDMASIEDALRHISETGRGDELAEALEKDIQVIDKFVWIC